MGDLFNFLMEHRRQHLPVGALDPHPGGSGGGINDLTIKQQRPAWLVAVVGNNQALAHGWAVFKTNSAKDFLI
jgi:hypothetical protein